MKVFFEYLYYICYNYYKRFKDKENPDYARGDKTIYLAALAAIVIGLFIYIQILVAEGQISEPILYTIILITSLFALVPFLYSIRYRKTINYKDDLHSKFEKLAENKIATLNTYAVIYLFIVFLSIFTIIMILFYWGIKYEP